jgi:hypothetical protein
MKKHFFLLLLLGFVLSVFVVSCKKDTDKTGNGVNNPYVPPTPQGPVLSSSLAGLGDHSGSPSGTAFHLPSNIKVLGHMYGGFPGKGDNFQYPKTAEGLKALLASTPKTFWDEYGLGTFVNIYATFTNTNTTPTFLVIPAGLIMRDSLNDSIPLDTAQGGIIIVPDTIIIRGGDTVNVVLKSFCTNLHHIAPDSQHHYGFSVVSNNDKIYQVISILRSKKSLLDHVSDIQSIIWNITDYGVLTQADIDLMNSWE